MSSFESSTYVSGQDAMTAPPLRLLSLDGGGIRGLSELIILDEIMNRLKYTLKHTLKSPVDLLPADYFDMICGTSTGGLIALLLGRLRFSTAEAIRCYASLGKEIFKNKRSKSVHGYAFDSSNMERAVKDLLEVKYGQGHGDDRMLAEEEETRHSCKAFVCAVSSSHVERDPTKFRTWSVAKDRSPNCKIWEAARATCAAPRFFQSIFIEENGIDEEFVDAGLGCNNPIKQLISEAKSEFAQTRPVACILSIGAGIPKAFGFTRPKSLTEKVAPMSLVNVLKGMATSTEKEAAEMEKKFANVPGVYNRINVGRDIGDIGLEELEELGQVKSHTRAYPRNDGMSRQIDGIVAALAHKTQPGIQLYQLDNHVTLPSVTQHICFPRSQADRHGFVPRSCMHAIDCMFNDVLLKTSSKTIVLQGMGGSGKTQLALYYCRKAVSQGGFKAVLWIDGTAKTSVEQSFSNIAHSIIGKSLGAVDIKSFLALVRNQIETWKEPWLLVFDNFDDPADYDITKYLPQSDSGLIIVTGRHPAGNDLGYSIPIGDLLEEEAMNLLFHRTKKERTHANVEDARKICCHLSCLALAVDQAGAYIKSRGIELSLFIEHFDKQQENIMAWSLPLKNYKRLDPATPDQEITLTVSTTWELSYNRISGSKENIEAKRHFLLVSAFFDGNCIDEYFFRRFFETISERPSWINMFQDQETHKWNSSIFLAVVTELRDLSLFQSISVSSQGVVYRFHPMTRKWALYRQSQTERQDLALETMDLLVTSNLDVSNSNLDEFTSKHPSLLSQIATTRDILPHIESCFLNCEKFVSESEAIGTSGKIRTGYNLASIFHSFEDVDKSELIFKRILLCPMKDAPKLWRRSLCHLCAVLVEYSRFQEAIELLTEALDSLPGPSMGTWCEVELLQCLALVYYNMGQIVRGEQRKLYKACTVVKKALAIIQQLQIFGKYDPLYGMNLVFLANVYGEIPGSMDFAQSLIVEVLNRLNKWEITRGSEPHEHRVYRGLGKGSVEVMLIARIIDLSVTWVSQGHFQNTVELQKKLLHHVEKFLGEQIWLKRHISNQLHQTLQVLEFGGEANEPKKKSHLETLSFAEKTHL